MSKLLAVESYASQLLSESLQCLTRLETALLQVGYPAPIYDLEANYRTSRKLAAIYMLNTPKGDVDDRLGAEAGWRMSYKACCRALDTISAFSGRERKLISLVAMASEIPLSFLILLLGELLTPSSHYAVVRQALEDMDELSYSSIVNYDTREVGLLLETLAMNSSVH